MRSAASFEFLTGLATERPQAQTRPGVEPAPAPDRPQETLEARELRSLFAQLKIDETLVGALNDNALASELAVDKGLVIVEGAIPLPGFGGIIKSCQHAARSPGAASAGAERNHLALLLLSPASRPVEDLAREIGAEHCQKLDGQTAATVLCPARPSARR